MNAINLCGINYKFKYVQGNLLPKDGKTTSNKGSSHVLGSPDCERHHVWRL